MASTTYTVTTLQDNDLQNRWHTVERTPEYKQFLAYLLQLDKQYIANYGTTYGANPNQLDGHSYNPSTKQMTVNTADGVLEHELPFFR